MLKKIIPLSTRNKLRRTFLHYSLKFGSKNIFMSKLYYFFLSREFGREEHAVLNGRRKYHNSVKNDVHALVLLRRNIHRVEKGLIMRPRKDAFGKAYIIETLVAYKTCVDNKIGEDAEIKWANDVLEKFFSSVTHSDHDEIGKAWSIYCSIDKNVIGTPMSDVPYTFSSKPDLDVSYEQLQSLFLNRRSVRWYEQKRVPEELIRKAVQQASLAPSACNRQPFSFHLTLEPEKAVKVANYAMGTAGFSHNIPAIIAVVGDLSAYPFERDRHVIYIDGSLASMQLMLSLETLGLSSCPINWPDIEDRDRKISEELGLEVYEKVIMLIAVGYGDKEGLIPFSQKKSADTLIKFIGEE
ncbi:nitroreductase family protein [Vibrio ishigakensis]|uniref:Nitroreductase family protein n=1 Tax=Vibrio ishigakensis TaxID=1481914 RepID=A0A0B8QGV8_9VIBR|nr:nitroreductase family protein [Vibrio ishigakensis]